MKYIHLHLYGFVYARLSLSYIASQDNHNQCHFVDEGPTNTIGYNYNQHTIFKSRLLVKTKTETITCI